MRWPIYFKLPINKFAARARPNFSRARQALPKPDKKQNKWRCVIYNASQPFFWFLLAIGVLWLLIVNTGWTSVAGRLR